MKPGRLVAALALIALGACGSTEDPQASSPDVSPARSGLVDERCADLVVVAVRGQSQSPDANLGAGTEIFRIAVDLAERVHARGDSTVRLESVDYDSSPPPDLATYDANGADGAALLRTQLSDLDRACPDTDAIVVGFSEGANVVHVALARGASTQVRAVAMVADPIRAPRGDVEQETFGKDAPFPGSLGAGPALGAVADRSLSFCNAADDVCNHTPGASRRGTQPVHKTFYEQPGTVAEIATGLEELLG